MYLAERVVGAGQAPFDSAKSGAFIALRLISEIHCHSAAGFVAGAADAAVGGPGAGAGAAVPALAIRACQPNASRCEQLPASPESISPATCCCTNRCRPFTDIHSAVTLKKSSPIRRNHLEAALSSGQHLCETDFARRHVQAASAEPPSWPPALVRKTCCRRSTRRRCWRNSAWRMRTEIEGWRLRVVPSAGSVHRACARCSDSNRRYWIYVKAIDAIEGQKLLNEEESKPSVDVVRTCFDVLTTTCIGSIRDRFESTMFTGGTLCSYNSTKFMVCMQLGKLTPDH